MFGINIRINKTSPISDWKYIKFSHCSWPDRAYLLLFSYRYITCLALEYCTQFQVRAPSTRVVHLVEEREYFLSVDCQSLELEIQHSIFVLVLRIDHLYCIYRLIMRCKKLRNIRDLNKYMIHELFVSIQMI